MKSEKLKIFIDAYYNPGANGRGWREYKALCEFLNFLESYPADNYNLVFTKSRLHSIFQTYLHDFNEVEDFIGELSYKYPYLLMPKYYFEDDREERVDLDAGDVFKYLSNRSNIDPVSGEVSHSITEFIFVEYVLNKEAVENV